MVVLDREWGGRCRGGCWGVVGGCRKAVMEGEGVAGAIGGILLLDDCGGCRQSCCRL